ncbi:hypothetical protein LTS18_002892, partial [Coniosporium uncinatum]
LAMMLILVAAQAIITGTFNDNAPEWIEYVALALNGLGYGGMLTITLLALISAVSHADQAVATSASYAFRSTGSTIGITIAGAVFQNMLKKQLHARLDGMKGADEIIARLRDSIDEIKNVPSSIRNDVLQAYIVSLRSVWAVLLGLAVLSLLVSLGMKENVLHKNLARSELQATQSYAAATVPHNASCVPIVDLGHVKYVGYSKRTAGINYWRGIPYAQPPLGQLRWRKPRPIEAKNNLTRQTIDATKIAPACIQNSPSFISPDSVGAVPQQSEDCLILDVLTPIDPVTDYLPVMVQIHGGGYTLGYAESSPGDAMVNFSNGSMIYVQIQDRLGPFGFLGGSHVAENGARMLGFWIKEPLWNGSSATFELLEAIRLRSLSGVAPQGSVTYQLMAGGGYDEPPFRAAIAEYPWWQPLLNESTQERQYYTCLMLANCTNLNCLRSMPAKNLAAVDNRAQTADYNGAGDGYGTFWFGPLVDGDSIQELPSQAFQPGNYYKVPLIVDHDAYEGVVFSNVTARTQVETTMDAKNLFPAAGPAFFIRLYQLYPRSSYNSTFFQRQQWYGDFIINCPTYFMASSAVDNLYNASSVWKLIFSQGTRLHAATAPYLASNVTGWPTSGNLALSQILSSYWISFAVTTDPNAMKVDTAPYWPCYYEGGPANGTLANGEEVGFSTLGVTYGGISVVADPDARAQCEFFGRNGYTVRN